MRLPDGRRAFQRDARPSIDDLDLRLIHEDDVLSVLQRCPTRLEIPRVLAPGLHLSVGPERGFTHRQPSKGHRPFVVAHLMGELARLPKAALDELERLQRASARTRGLLPAAEASHENLVRAHLYRLAATADAVLGDARERLGLPDAAALRNGVDHLLPHTDRNRPNVLVHGDLHEENIVWVGRRQGNLLDFERCIANGDPAHDLAVYLKRGAHGHLPHRQTLLHLVAANTPGERVERLDAAERRFRVAEDLGEMYRLAIREVVAAKEPESAPRTERAYAAYRDGLDRLGRRPVSKDEYQREILWAHTFAPTLPAAQGVPHRRVLEAAVQGLGAMSELNPPRTPTLRRAALGNTNPARRTIRAALTRGRRSLG
ncbi:aminoglycoside phosphotransferase family protein [Yinghuangia sp. ASG 101]|nr:aminoglycoside phosphotransferase family protein [Yinghuangia sp. ASG 101]